MRRNRIPAGAAMLGILWPGVAGNRHHLLQFQYETASPKRGVTLQNARAWGICNADDIPDAVAQAVAGFRRLTLSLGATKSSIDTVDADRQA